MRAKQADCCFYCRGYTWNDSDPREGWCNLLRTEVRSTHTCRGFARDDETEQADHAKHTDP